MESELIEIELDQKYAFNILVALVFDNVFNKNVINDL